MSENKKHPIFYDKPVANNNHQFESNKKYYIISVYTVFTVVICAIIAKLIFSWDATTSFIGGYLDALTPVVAGFFIAYLMNPMVNFFDQKLFSLAFRKSKKPHQKASRYLAMVLSYIIVLGAIIIILVYLVPQLSSSVVDLLNRLQAWYEKVYVLADNLHEKFPSIDFELILDKVKETSNNFLSAEKLTTFAANVIPTLFSTSVAVIKALYYLLFSVMISVYVLADKRRIVNNLKRLVRAVFRKPVANQLMMVGRLSHSIFSSFIAGKTLDSAIIGVMCFILMSVFQFPFALLISIIVGITNMIPYVGPWVGAIPGLFIIAIIDPMQALFYVILIFALQQFDGLYLGPKILGSSTGLRPVWIIFAITIGGAVGNGPLSCAMGMFLGVPTVAVIANLLDQWINVRIAMKNAASEEAAPEKAEDKKN